MPIAAPRLFGCTALRRNRRPLRGNVRYYGGVTMFTEVLLKKEKRPVKNRKLLIWIGSLGVGLVAFAGTLALRSAMESSASNPFFAPQGVVYDQGMTDFARHWQGT